MARPVFNLLTSAILFMGAIFWTKSGNVVAPLLWLALTLGYLGVSAYQFATRCREVVPQPGKRLARRFSRFVLFWS